MKFIVIDWANNVLFNCNVFDSEYEALDFITDYFNDEEIEDIYTVSLNDYKIVPKIGLNFTYDGYTAKKISEV